MDSFSKTIRSLQRVLLMLTGALAVAMVALFVLLAMRLGWINTKPAQPEAELLSLLHKPATTDNKTAKADKPLWQPPAESVLAAEKDADLIRYGKELIINTATYLGPKGKVAHLSNGMNCQNCHLDAGAKPWGNNYSAVASTYPKFRERSGTTESIEKRVNDCFERSLNGNALDSSSREMRGIVAYIKFLGQGVPKGESPKGSGIWKLDFLDRPADPAKGKMAYDQKCVTCHSANGQGIPKSDGTGYTFPPLWGNHSYNQGAGLYRISRLAGYIKTNMPLGATFEAPQLSDDEAWDIAAYIESMPHPKKDLSHDWPNIAGKPIDHPFGPYADGFSEQQHKYGPFKPIKNWKDQHDKPLK